MPGERRHPSRRTGCCSPVLSGPLPGWGLPGPEGSPRGRPGRREGGEWGAPLRGGRRWGLSCAQQLRELCKLQGGFCKACEPSSPRASAPPLQR